MTFKKVEKLTHGGVGVRINTLRKSAELSLRRETKAHFSFPDTGRMIIEVGEDDDFGLLRLTLNQTGSNDGLKYRPYTKSHASTLRSCGLLKHLVPGLKSKECEILYDRSYEFCLVVRVPQGFIR